MITHIATDRRANILGGIWMVVSMAAFAIEDALVKTAAETLPVGQVLVLFGLGGASVFAGLAALNKERLFVTDVLSRPMQIRACFEVLGRLFYMLAIALTPLSSATVILQATPLVVVAGAAIVFGEKVGWRRWAAILIGLIGVVVIIQPGTDSFSILSVLAVLGMIGFAGRDLASRAAPATLGTTLLGFYGFLSIIIAGIVFSCWEMVPFVKPDIKASLCLLAAMLAGTFAYASLMKAMRSGEVSVVTPFRYTRLVFGLTLGIAFFGERLVPSMMFGAGLIIVSGFFILWRGQRSGR
ncbi:DMT family transporter [Rhodalgimonas zhirmunskyi]|uniref:DMT family transporter n=1 Tax=Rhodalgimonas zhirmunskyi TaxID=2964767 RepID=A0AAJ1U6U3_9RHOB|nr:DMT family transporter [Rhodoalgimonas zhirmunskyi]MDQ2094546.1 DMT family transporter [Rhodoalgimonas zhirmunskyi]